MNRAQLYKQLQLIHKDLTKVELRMQKIASKLHIEEHEYLTYTIAEIESLLEMFEENEGESS